MAKTEVKISVKPIKAIRDAVVCGIHNRGLLATDYVDGGVINLPKLAHSSDFYELSFKLQSGSAGLLNWHPNPFSCSRNSCPTGAGLESQFSNVSVDGDELVVEVHPDGTENLVHYALKFVDDGTPPNEYVCDPIIINGLPPSGGGGGG